MFEDMVTERISVADGTLIICRKYIALQKADGTLLPADMDEYGQYLPIWQLIRLIPYNRDLSDQITEATRAMLEKAFLGQIPRLSHILYCRSEDAATNKAFLGAINPRTEEDYVRVFSLICSGFKAEDADIPFFTRDDLRQHLGCYLNDDDAYRLSEAVRKSLFFAENPQRELQKQKYKDLLALLPQDTVNAFAKIKYLPERAIMQRIIHYAIMAANRML